MAAMIPAESGRKPTISLTPLIDIVFILLVFFMLAVQFQKLQQRQLQAAESGAAVVDSSDDLPLVMTLQASSGALNCELKAGTVRQTGSCDAMISQIATQPQLGNGLLLAFADEARLQDILTVRGRLEQQWPQVQLVLEAPADEGDQQP